jgi:hypothetical protein
MESPDRPSSLDAVTESDAPTPYPRLSAVQRRRVLAELAQEYRLDNLRRLRTATVEPKAEQLALFSHDKGRGEPGKPRQKFVYAGGELTQLTLDAPSRRAIIAG